MKRVPPPLRLDELERREPWWHIALSVCGAYVVIVIVAAFIAWSVHGRG